MTRPTFRYSDTCSGKCGGHFTSGETKIYPFEGDNETALCEDCAFSLMVDDLQAGLDVVFFHDGLISSKVV